jgi:hypothetical protein
MIKDMLEDIRSNKTNPRLKAVDMGMLTLWVLCCGTALVLFGYFIILGLHELGKYILS